MVSSHGRYAGRVACFCSEIDARLFHRTASYPHYDITLEMRILVIEHGAIDADRRTIIACGKRLKLQLGY